MQHDPTPTDGVKMLKDLVPMTRSPGIVRAMAEGDLVIIHGRASEGVGRIFLVGTSIISKIGSASIRRMIRQDDPPDMYTRYYWIAVEWEGEEDKDGRVQNKER